MNKRLLSWTQKYNNNHLFLPLGHISNTRSSQFSGWRRAGLKRSTSKVRVACRDTYLRSGDPTSGEFLERVLEAREFSIADSISTDNLWSNQKQQCQSTKPYWFVHTTMGARKEKLRLFHMSKKRGNRAQPRNRPRPGRHRHEQLSQQGRGRGTGVGLGCCCYDLGPRHPCTDLA